MNNRLPSFLIVPGTEMKRLIIFAITVSALSFIVSNASGYTSTQNFEQWMLLASNRTTNIFFALETSDRADNLITEPLKDTPSAELPVYNKSLMDAGRSLEIAAGLRYAGFGLGLASVALSRSSDETALDLSKILRYGSITLLISPYYIGKAGKELTRTNLDSEVKEAGKALQKYRSSYYGGLTTTILGTGLLAIQIHNESDTDEPRFIASAVITLGGLVYTALAPPYHLGTAGSYLYKTRTPSEDINSQMRKVGSHLMDAGISQYYSLAVYLLGGALTAYSVSKDDNSGILLGSCILGFGVLSDLLTAVRINLAGAGLDKASKIHPPKSK